MSAGTGGLGVLVVEGHLRENGGLRVSHDIARVLPRHGTPTTLFVVQRVDDGSTQLTPDTSVDVRFGSDRPRRLRKVLPGALVRLVVAARRCDVVLAGSEIGWGLLLGWAAGRLAGRPVAVLVQGSLDRAVSDWLTPLERLLTRWVHRHVDRALCVSGGLVEEIVTNGLPRERVEVVQVGIDVAAVLAAGDLDGPLPAAPYFLAAGRLAALKGFDVLVRAVAEAGAALEDHRVVIYGEGPERASLEALVAALGIGGRVSLPGFSANLHPALARASAFVLSSRSEGMGGLVLLEAMAHGTPIIATDCVSGPRELLEGGRIGRLVPVEDVAALAQALIDHARDPAPLREIARRGPARALKFGADGWVVTLTDALYRGLGLGERPGAPVVTPAATAAVAPEPEVSR